MGRCGVVLGCVAISSFCVVGWGQSDGLTGVLKAPEDPRIAAAIAKISPEKVQKDVEKLVSFGTRNTLSSMQSGLATGIGIGPAADWLESEFQAISAACGGCLEVKRDEFVEPGSSTANSRIKQPTKLVNVYAVMHGTEKAGLDKPAPWVLVTGHYDSRATDVMDPKVTAPGANDDASGVAVSLESARALAGMKLPGTIVFVAVAGEEQGLNGSRHLAQLAKKEGWPLEAVLNNDIVGGDTTPGDPGAANGGQDKMAVRVFSENVPATATAEQVKQMLALGAENDSPSRELAREVAEVGAGYFKPTEHHAGPAAPGIARSHAVRLEPGFHAVLIARRDRYLRGGDHTSFNGEGFAAVRLTEWRENFNHQHQTVRTEGGVEYGDLLKFVDFGYTAQVARLNAAVLASLASAPGEPRNVKVSTKGLDNSTELTWDAPEFAPAGTAYEVVWRESGTMLWDHAQAVPSGTNVKLDVSKDNVLFGVRAVDAQGHRSLAVAPVPAGMPGTSFNAIPRPSAPQ